MTEKPLHKSKKTKAPWERPRLRIGKGIKLSSEQVAEARERAAKAGRRYPNLIDNMAVAKKHSH